MGEKPQLVTGRSSESSVLGGSSQLVYKWLITMVSKSPYIGLVLESHLFLRLPQKKNIEKPTVFWEAFSQVFFFQLSKPWESVQALLSKGLQPGLEWMKYMKQIKHWMIRWIHDWRNGWLVEWMIDWLNEWMNEWMNDWLNDIEQFHHHKKHHHQPCNCHIANSIDLKKPTL